MARSSIVSHVYVASVVMRGDLVLLVQEAKPHRHGLWYLPAGGVEAGEDLVEAARREAFEEAGVDIRVVGLFGIEHTVGRDAHSGWARWRYLFVAEPTDDRTPKSRPDEHSLRADWFDDAAIARLDLRNAEVPSLIARARTQSLLPITAYSIRSAEPTGQETR